MSTQPMGEQPAATLKALGVTDAELRLVDAVTAHISARLHAEHGNCEAPEWLRDLRTEAAQIEQLEVERRALASGPTYRSSSWGSDSEASR